MTSDTDRMLARLRAAHPAWQVWVVHRVVGGAVWCARRLDDFARPPRTLINVSTPDDLSVALAEADADAEQEGTAHNR